MQRKEKTHVLIELGNDVANELEDLADKARVNRVGWRGLGSGSRRKLLFRNAHLEPENTSIEFRQSFRSVTTGFVDAGAHKVFTKKVNDEHLAGG